MRLSLILAPALMALAACAPDPFAVDRLAEGEASDARRFLAANEGKTFCSNYQASTNSCQSLLKFAVRGNMVTSREIAAVNLTGEVERVTLRTKLWVEDNKVCTNAENIHLAAEAGPGAQALLGVTRDLTEQVGGICTEIFVTQNGYISRITGRNGEVVPPGDIALTIAPANAVLRAQ